MLSDITFCFNLLSLSVFAVVDSMGCFNVVGMLGMLGMLCKMENSNVYFLASLFINLY